MARARTLISNAWFSRKKLTMLSNVFDQVWASVASDFGDHPDDIEAGRIRLATIVLDLAEDGQLGPNEITHTAGRLIRINQFIRSDA